MELKQKYKVINQAYFADRDNEPSDNEVEAFSVKLEDLMNEYKVISINAFLDPYQKGIGIK